MSVQLHASVLQFLIDHGYLETVETFKKEAKTILDSSEAFSEVSSEELAHHLSQLHIQR